MCPIIVGIDATNLRDGGGRTHIIELLKAAKPEKQGIEKIIIWGSRDTLDLLEDRPWLKKLNPSAQEKGLFSRSLWQKYQLSKDARSFGCDILFVPGGSYSGKYHPVVTMSRNLLPFEYLEMLRYGISLMMCKMVLLRITQTKTFRNVNGVIFLTDYAKRTVEKITGILPKTAIIHHGLNISFLIEPRIQKSITYYSDDNPYRILYVSRLEPYKHQHNVVTAVAKLRNTTGWSIVLELVGPANVKYKYHVMNTIKEHDPEQKWIVYRGSVPFEKLHDIYENADLGLFASSCENMPNILLETMASGLPVASSYCGPMPEILEENGVYFNPENSQNIAESIKKIIGSPELRQKYSRESFRSSQKYSWERCAAETFSFLVDVYRENLKVDR